MKVLSGKEVRTIEKCIETKYGSRFDMSKFAVLSDGTEVRLGSKSIFKINFEGLRIKSVGLLLGRYHDKDLRLNVEASQLIGRDAKQNIAEIDDVWNFMRGFDVAPTKTIDCEEGEYVMVKHESDWLGVAKYEKGMLKNVLPRSRKITSLKQ